MNTKEAIEFVKGLIGFYNYPVSADGVDEEQAKVNNQKRDDVIDLLKRGEKYEAIVREIKYEIDWHRPEREVYDSGSKGDDEYINETLDLIDKIEQKYFPKPSKNFTKKVMNKIRKEVSQ